MKGSRIAALAAACAAVTVEARAAEPEPVLVAENAPNPASKLRFIATLPSR
ncbi:MAG TPA: hypothetical protein VMQ11_05000 [Alphaproteobacteria bacterium]|nr:hypothetical protein [Alphaproteobacteria bacterium]